ncbi:MAG: DinB family protein [Phycisphaerales bacterium JB052]
MPTAPHAVLLAHDRWANAKLYDACEPLSHDQFTQSFPMGCGSLRNNLVHNLSATRGWTDVLNESPARDRLTEDAYTLIQIRAMHDEICDAFEAAALKRPFDTVINRQRGDDSYTFTVGGIIAHVTTHAMHHRAQCLNMLRQLGVKDMPMSSVMEWMLFAEGQ